MDLIGETRDGRLHLLCAHCREDVEIEWANLESNRPNLLARCRRCETVGTVELVPAQWKKGPQQPTR